MATTTHTIILGAGIIGTSTAHYLSLSPRTAAHTIHLVEPSPRLFASASGFAGGFLAQDWFAPAAAELGRLSFRLHGELAAEHDGRKRWGYCRSQGTSLMRAGGGGGRGEEWLMEGGSRAQAAGEEGGRQGFGNGGAPGWLRRGRGDEVEMIGDGEGEAQVDPLRLCEFLMEKARERGVVLHHPARAISVSMDMRGELATVRIAKEDGEEVDIPCSRLVITAGAWSPQVFSTLFPKAAKKLPIGKLAGHSLVVRSPRWAEEHEANGCHAVFTTDPSGISPEIFSRIGGEIYIAGLNDSTLPLPKQATDSKPDPEAIETLKEISRRLLGLPRGEDDLQIVRGGLCFRPVTARGTPFISRIPDEMLGAGISTRGGGDGGVFLAAGHGPWGISHSLGTGKVLSEMIEGEQPSAKVNGLSL